MTFLRALTITLLAAICVPLPQAQSNFNTVQLTITTIDVPGAHYTGVWGINSVGDMVGNYGQDTNVDSHGFLYSNGAFTYFEYPGQTVTLPRGINDSGLIAGYAGRNPVIGFLYDGTTFTTLKHGSDSATFVIGINNAGDLAGGTGTIYTTKGFELSGGHYKRLSPPGSYVYVYATGVNNLGEVVGYTNNGGDQRGFAFNGGRSRSILFPGAMATEVLGVNDQGTVVGWYQESSPPYDFYAFALKNGKYLSFKYPGTSGTFAIGINASGQIVGEYTSDFSTYHGFVTSPITDQDF